MAQVTGRGSRVCQVPETGINATETARQDTTMSEQYRGPRVVPEMTVMERHSIVWWVSIVTVVIVLWVWLAAIVIWVFRR